MLTLANATVPVESLSAITDTFNSNVTALIPVGVGILGIMLGIRVIPRVVYTFF